MDLFSSYLLVIILLFSINISLFLGNLKLENIKLLGISLVLSAVSFISMNMGLLSFKGLSFLLNYFSYFFILISLILFMSYVLYYKGIISLTKSLGIIIILLIVSEFLLSSQSSQLTLFMTLLYSLIMFISLFIIFKVSKFLQYAKREYPVIIGEFVLLSAILIFILGLTYYSTLNLDYEMFSSFLILTPTYQLVYVIIAMVVIMIVGLFYNENGGKL